MKIATWNVNSLNVRLPHLLDWLASTQTNVVCLQETKQTDDKFPHAALLEAGYHSAFVGQKTYNGVAIISKHELHDVEIGMADFYADEQKRLIAATVQGVRVVCAYFPNGQEVGSDKYRYKLDWCDGLLGYIEKNIKQHSKLALLGDYNIAPEDRDVHDPAAWVGQVLVSDKEREVFKRLQGLGLVDAFRQFEQAEKSFSWWDYRQLGFRLNKGMRIDHILLSPELSALCEGCTIDRAPRKLQQPSDHTPVWADLRLA